MRLKKIETPEKIIVGYLKRKGHSQDIILETCRDESLGLDDKLVKLALNPLQKEKRKLQSEINLVQAQRMIDYSLILLLRHALIVKQQREEEEFLLRHFLMVKPKGNYLPYYNNY